jgi:hypothetical protein
LLLEVPPNDCYMMVAGMAVHVTVSMISSIVPFPVIEDNL